MKLEHYRAAIDILDRTIIEAVRHRAIAVKRIAEFKCAKGLPPVDEVRERRIAEHYASQLVGEVYGPHAELIAQCVINACDPPPATEQRPIPRRTSTAKNTPRDGSPPPSKAPRSSGQ